MSDKGNAWLVGFIEKCADAGLNVQEIEALIKLSAQDRLFEDPNFQAGFEEKLAQFGYKPEMYAPPAPRTKPQAGTPKAEKPKKVRDPKKKQRTKKKPTYYGGEESSWPFRFSRR